MFLLKILVAGFERAKMGLNKKEIANYSIVSFVF